MGEYLLIEDVWFYGNRDGDIYRLFGELIRFLDDTGSVEFDRLDIDDSFIFDNSLEVVKLHEGHSADVYCLTDLASGDRYVLKLGIRLDDDDERLYVNDGFVLSGLSGLDFIVNVWAYRHDFVLMDYIEGDVLYDLDRDYRREFVDTVISYMEEMHELGYIAYDVHCDNLILDKQGRLMVIDVGDFMEVGNARVTFYEAKRLARESLYYS